MQAILQMSESHHSHDDSYPVNLLLGCCFPKLVDSTVQDPGSRVWECFAVNHSTFSCCRCHISGKQSKQLLAPANNLECGPNHLLFFFSSHSPILMPYFFRMLVFPVIQRPILIHICSALSPSQREHLSPNRKTSCAPALFH